jgi:hypothetical protein
MENMKKESSSMDQSKSSKETLTSRSEEDDEESLSDSESFIDEEIVQLDHLDHHKAGETLKPSTVI